MHKIVSLNYSFSFVINFYHQDITKYFLYFSKSKEILITLTKIKGSEIVAYINFFSLLYSYLVR